MDGRRRGRRELPVDPENGPAARLAVELRQLRNEAGRPSYKNMNPIAHVSTSALSEAARGRRWPTWEVVAGYVTACGGDLAVWRARWEELSSSDEKPSDQPESAQSGDIVAPDVLVASSTARTDNVPEPPNGRTATVVLAALRTRLALVVAAAVVLGLSVLVMRSPGAPMSANQPPSTGPGGCTTYVVQDYNVGVCVNNGNTTDFAYPDIYINVAPYVGADCNINISVWDDHNRRYSAKEFPCTESHDAGDPAGPFTVPTTVHAYARLDLHNRAYWIGNSPEMRIGG